MYGLPKDLSLEFLFGQSLLQVCVGVHDLILNFDDNVTITVTSRIGCARRDGAEHEHVDFRKAASELMVFLSQSIAKAEGCEDGTLRLTFDAGETLTIYDDSEKYESYSIQHRNGLIVV